MTGSGPCTSGRCRTVIAVNRNSSGRYGAKARERYRLECDLPGKYGSGSGNTGVGCVCPVADIQNPIGNGYTQSNPRCRGVISDPCKSITCIGHQCMCGPGQYAGG